MTTYYGLGDDNTIRLIGDFDEFPWEEEIPETLWVFDKQSLLELKANIDEVLK